MLGTLLFNGASLIYAIIGSLRGRKIFLIAALACTFVFLSIRSDFGNDLARYEAIFEEIAATEWRGIYDVNPGFEKGYVFWNKLFSIAGFNAFLATAAWLSILGYYRLISVGVVPSLRFFSVFLLLFNPGIILIQSSAVRQSIAVAFFVLSSGFLVERKPFRFVAMILVGSTFHVSVLVMLPLYFVLRPAPIARKTGFFHIGLYVVAVLAGSSMIRAVMGSGFAFLERYNVYAGMDSTAGQVVTHLVRIAFLLFLGQYGRGATGLGSVAIRAVMIGYVIFAFGSNLTMIVRLSFYLEPFAIVAFPVAVRNIKSRRLAHIVITLVMMYYLRVFFNFFADPTWREAFSTYRTIFS
ncbi:MAG: EpsG family protein [Spirochaetales bacterium]|nr:EpsG family protein [Spirochaetales bacterium]